MSTNERGPIQHKAAIRRTAFLLIGISILLSITFIWGLHEQEVGIAAFALYASVILSFLDFLLIIAFIPGGQSYNGKWQNAQMIDILDRQKQAPSHQVIEAMETHKARVNFLAVLSLLFLFIGISSPYAFWVNANNGIVLLLSSMLCASLIVGTLALIQFALTPTKWRPLTLPIITTIFSVVFIGGISLLQAILLGFAQ